MYVLPNDNKIDEDGLVDAFLDHNIKHVYYLDSISGDIGFVAETDKKVGGKDFDPKRYFKIPKINLLEKWGWVQEFISVFVYPKNKTLVGRLQKLTRDMDNYDKVLDLFRSYPRGLEGDWDQWENDSVWAKIDPWIMSLPISISDVWETDDDCELCKLIEKGNHSVGDFLEVSAKQNQKNTQNVRFNASLKDTEKLRDKNDLYYDAMEMIGAGEYKIAENFLVQARAIDPEYVQTYVGLANVYGISKKQNKAKESIKIAFEKTQKMFPTWPKKMYWGELDNRAYLRAIQYRGDLYADGGEKEKAIDLYRLLLRLNPNDNQGVRYILAGLYAGISGEKINKMFDDGNEKQDWNKLEKLVKEQNDKYKFWKEPKRE